VRFIDRESQVGPTKSRKASAGGIWVIRWVGGQHPGHPLVEGSESAGTNGSQQIVFVREVVVSGAGRDL
jgi:hypothetical protein